MSTALATAPEEVMVGLEFEFGVQNDQGFINESHDLRAVRDAVDETAAWHTVNEHTGAEANLDHPIPLDSFGEVMAELSEALHSVDGVIPVMEHQELVGFHVHLNVENSDVGAGLHLPTLWDTYLDGFQERMWNLTTFEERRLRTSGNHTKRDVAIKWVDAIAAFGREHPFGTETTWGWRQNKGWDFAPRATYGSVELRTWNATLDTEALEQRYTFLRDLAAATIANTPIGAKPTDWVTGQGQLVTASEAQAMNKRRDRLDRNGPPQVRHW